MAISNWLAAGCCCICLPLTANALIQSGGPQRFRSPCRRSYSSGKFQFIGVPSQPLPSTSTSADFSFSLKATDSDEDYEIHLPELEGPTVELTDTEIELISRKLKETIDLPFLPDPIEKQIVKAALTSFCSVAPLALPEGLFQDLVSGNQDWEAVKEEFIQEINDQICIPIVSRKVQDQIVDGICNVMFTSKSEKATKRQVIGRALQTALNQESDEEFASMLNGMIDIPIMSEEQEQKVFLKLAKSINNAFETMVPEPMRVVLTNTSPEDLQEARKNLIDRMNEKIRIPFKSEKEQRKYFKLIVDFLLKRYGLSKGTKLPAEVLLDLEKELNIVKVELEVQEAIYDRKMRDLNDQKDSLTKRIAELEELV